jgi:hypothetical protein
MYRLFGKRGVEPVGCAGDWGTRALQQVFVRMPPFALGRSLLVSVE